MQLLEEKVVDVGKEKHVPVIEVSDGTVKVKVGTVPHPMDEDHYIEWIELLTEKGGLQEPLEAGREARSGVQRQGREGHS
jgi:superoxide reductase